VTAKSMLMRSQGRRVPPLASLCYATATLQTYPPTDLKLTNFNDTRMGVSRGGQGPRPPGFSCMILLK